MGQLSFYSAEATSPEVGDLAGLLCAPGRAVGFGRGTAAQVWIGLAQSWRAATVAAACAERGVPTRLTRDDEGISLLSTAFRADLTGLASAGSGGAGKAVPTSFSTDGRVLRMWALAAGRVESSAYLLGLDPLAPQTHDPLAGALTAAGLPVTVVAASDGGPALRLVGRRRLARLAELVGPAPAGATDGVWPLG